MAAVRCGLGSVVPLQLLSLLTPLDLDLRVCGLPNIDLHYLKVRLPIEQMVAANLPSLPSFSQRHTTYHVGLMESDRHVQFFWSALKSFSQVINTLQCCHPSLPSPSLPSFMQEELRKFIKFACNPERIPFGHPCRDGGEKLTHVPPYPMKIAPPDGSGQPSPALLACPFHILLLPFLLFLLLLLRQS